MKWKKIEQIVNRENRGQMELREKTAFQYKKDTSFPDEKFFSLKIQVRRYFSARMKLHGNGKTKLDRSNGPVKETRWQNTDFECYSRILRVRTYSVNKWNALNGVEVRS